MRHGFTLIELAIVLVIIGLLVAGILMGKSLLISAQLRAVNKEINSDISAINTFRAKYNGLPGDLRNATSFWGTSTSCSGTSATGTCNGNGDKQLTVATESLRAWQQLQLANLISGSYTGTTVGAGVEPIGVSLPVSKFPNATRYLQWDSGFDNMPMVGNILIVGGIPPGYNGSAAPWEGVFTAEQAYDLDVKMDDGLADHGKLVANSGSSYYLLTNKCTTIHTAPFTYVLSDPIADCHIYYFFD